MRTVKQQKANQANAKLGGVKTIEGKKAIRFNALKHGIWGKLISEYEQDMYQDVLEEMVSELKPKGIIQQILVERIAVAYLRLYRLAKAENEYIRSNLDPDALRQALKPSTGYSPDLGSTEMQNIYQIYSRYETSIENRFYRAIRELQAMKNGFVLQNGAENGYQ